MALALVTWGALTDRRWTVPVAAGWSALALYETSVFLVWAAAIPLYVGTRVGSIARVDVADHGGELRASDSENRLRTA